MDGLSASEIFFSCNKRKRSRLTRPQRLDVSKNKRCIFRFSEWRDWPGLPEHLLFDIFDKLTFVEDLIHFGRVCSSWQSVFLHNIKMIRSPFLLVAPPPTDKNYYDRRALYNVSNGRVYSIRMKLPHNKICSGSSFGWLVTMEKKDIGRYEVQLHNLILNRTLNLPSLDDIVHLQANDIGGPHFLRKAVLSSDPVLSDNFMIMGIMSRFCGLAFFKPVNRSWTSIGYPWSSSSGRRKMYSDVTFIHSVGQFYALRVNGSVFAIKFPPGIGQPKLTKVARRLNFTGSKMYLVEDSATGDLLQVHKSRLLSKKDQNGKFHNVVYFSVFKLDPVERKWIKMRHLGNKILFLGNNSSILRTASDCPGCIPNCIYYTSDYNEIGIPKRCYKPPFAGIYNVEDDSIHPHYTLKKTKKVVPWTIWLEPNFIRCNATLGSASIG